MVSLVLRLASAWSACYDGVGVGRADLLIGVGRDPLIVSSSHRAGLCARYDSSPHGRR